jgi:hypothetical protein
MNADCPCEAGPRFAVRGRLRRLGGSSAAVALGLAATLVPKCPLCVAAYLSVLGLSGAAAGALAPLLLPVGEALLAVSVLWTAFILLRPSRT